MKLISIGYNHLHKSTFEIDRPDGIDSWLFLLIKTPAIFHFGGKEIEVSANSFVIFQSEFPHYYRANNQEYIDDWFHFVPTEEEIAFFHSINIPLNQVIPLVDITMVSNLIRNITYEFNSDNIFKDQVINLNIKLLLYKISQILYNNDVIYPSKDSIYFLRMQALRNDIYNNPQVDRNVDSMATELSMSRSAFQHNYKKIFGKSVISDIISSRLRKVKLYLVTTDFTLEEIALLCGYHNQLHLIRQFKQYCGMTPTEFRKCR